MIVDRYDPINLFELVPKLRLEMEPELAELDRLLDDEVLFETVKEISRVVVRTQKGSDDTPRRLR